jgi:hypothetical protein
MKRGNTNKDSRVKKAKKNGAADVKLGAITY